MNFQCSSFKNDGQSRSNDFGIELDRIGSFQEFYNSISKMTLKPDWNFVKNASDVVIFKIKSVNESIPKLSVIIKINEELNIDVWVEDVALDVKSSLWKLLGYNFENDKIDLRYSMLLELIRFLDGNQLLVTNRRHKWDFHAKYITKVVKSDENYCRICFKTFVETQMTKLDDKFIDFISTQVEWLTDESLSKMVCQSCSSELDGFVQFQKYLCESQNFLSFFLKNDDNKVEEPEDQLILIRAHYDTPQVENFHQVTVETTTTEFPSETTYDEEWLLEEVDMQQHETKVDVYESSINLEKNHEIDPSTSTCEQEHKSCEISSKQLLSRRSPAEQKSVEVNADGKFQCPECPKSYPVKATLNKHMYRVHSP